MDDLGGIQWELLGTLTMGWIIVYLIIWKGLHASGKVLINMSSLHKSIQIVNQQLAFFRNVNKQLFIFFKISQM